MEANEFTGMDDSFIRFDTLVVGVSRDECLSRAEFRHVLYGAHAHDHADEILNSIKEQK